MKFLKYLAILILLITGKSFAAEFYANENGKLVEYGTIVEDYVTKDGKRISYGTVIDRQRVLRAGPAPGSREYWKRRQYREKKVRREALEREIRENRVPYPAELDKQKTYPSYKTVHDQIWNGPCTHNLSKKDKMTMINDYINYYKAKARGVENQKGWEYFDRDGVLMVRTPKGRILNAGLIKWGLSVGVLQHRFKNKRASSIMITAPSCSRPKKCK